MDGMKMARIRQCTWCRHWRNNGAQWPWPECWYKIEEGRVLDRAKALILDDAFMEGPHSNCPAGKFATLVAVDLEVEAVKAEAETAERMGTFLKPFADRLDTKAFEDATVELVASGAFSVKQVELGVAAFAVSLPEAPAEK